MSGEIQAYGKPVKMSEDEANLMRQAMYSHWARMEQTKELLRMEQEKLSKEYAEELKELEELKNLPPLELKRETTSCYLKKN